MALFQGIVMSYCRWKETSVEVYGRSHVGILSEKYDMICINSFNIILYREGWMIMKKQCTLLL